MKSEDKTIIEKLSYPLQQFLHNEASGGILLIICTIIALVWANSTFAGSYHSLWHTHLSINAGGFALDYSLHHWINDGLMVVFFFVGLAVLHATLANMKAAKAWLVAAYILMSLLPQAMLMVVVTGLFDPWLDLRRRTARA